MDRLPIWERGGHYCVNILLFGNNNIVVEQETAGSADSYWLLSIVCQTSVVSVSSGSVISYSYYCHHHKLNSDIPNNANGCCDCVCGCMN